MTPETYHATIRLGIVLSTIAAAAAVTLSLVADVSRWSLVASVTIIGAIASWVQSGHTMHATPRAGVPHAADRLLADRRVARWHVADRRVADSPAAHPFG